jgi:plasmid stabilization system protein ParE
MDYVLTFRAEARDEMEDAYNWYEDQKATLGEDFLACVDTTLDRIEQRPEAYRVVFQDFRRAVIHRFPYVIYYRIISSRIIIIAVVHGKRDPKIWQSRK